MDLGGLALHVVLHGGTEGHVVAPMRTVDIAIGLPAVAVRNEPAGEVTSEDKLHTKLHLTRRADSSSDCSEIRIAEDGIG